MKTTIITIHLNDFAGLARTMNSLEMVGYGHNTEWIFIDGRSEIQSELHARLLKNAKLKADTFLSEPDDGIYDAMNKGTRLATGDYILYLNAGDELHPKFKINHLCQFAIKTRPGMIWGQCMECYQDGQMVQIKTRSPSWAWYCMPAYHPAIFFRKDLLGENPYDASFQIAGDYDLVCRLLKYGAGIERYASIVSIFHRGGISQDISDVKNKEEELIRRRYFRVPAVMNLVIRSFRLLFSHLSRWAWLRGLWRKWI